MSAQTAADAEAIIGNLNAIMDSLLETVEEETARVRAGHVRRALELESAKAELARRYATESERLKAAKDLVARTLPEKLAALRERHGVFEAKLRTNLTVLATAHAVAEGIVRGVSGELARKRAPSTYGATGRANSPGPKTSQPLALSRSL